MEIAIYGGSFNPPTRSHEAIARACLNAPGIDEVWVMPSADRFDKQYSVSDEDRLQMLAIMCAEAFEGNSKLKVSDFELMHLPRPTETYKTVAALQARYPNDVFRFVFGSDSYTSMPAWHQGVELQEALNMLVVPRVGFPVPYAKNIEVVEVEAHENCSSTAVRERVKQGISIEDMVCDGVRRYIVQHNLYS